MADGRYGKRAEESAVSQSLCANKIGVLYARRSADTSPRARDVIS